MRASTLKPECSNGAPGDAQKDLRLFRMLLSNLDGMVYRCRIDESWTLEFVSEGSMRLLGYRPEDLLMNRRVSYEEVTHPEDRKRVRDSINAAIRSRQMIDVEYRIRRADGAVRWVWERGTAVYAVDGRCEALEGFVQDISERKDAEQRYRSIFENAVEGIFQTTPEGTYLSANPALARIYGYDSPEELIASLRDIRKQLYVDASRRDEFRRRMSEESSISGFESEVYRKDGEVIWISETARAVYDENGNVTMFEGTVEDITERKRYQVELEYQANHDALTGLPNRALLNDRLHQAIRYAQRHGTGVAVAFLDLDRFKIVNDSLGHYIGDSLLKIVATRLQSCLREGDTVARQGGDEFVLLLSSHEDKGALVQVMHRVLGAVMEPFRIAAQDFNVSCSIGISVFPDDGRDAQTLLKHADSAMYKAKATGRNNFQFFTAELNDGITERLEMETRLRRAVDDDQLLLHYQPKLDLGTGSICGAEALLRWHLAGGAMIPPQRFIPIAEDTGLIVPIGAWVLRTACNHHQARQAAGLQPVPISVNVSASQFRDHAFVEMVAAVLQGSGMPPHCLEIELTESMVMHGAESFIATLRALKKLGVTIAVDDFGTGYSSLNYLRRFPVDRLKVDRSFICEMTVDRHSAAIVKAIITLAHALDLRVVAEGVETEQQLLMLRAYGCDEIQGYFYRRPLPHSDFEVFLAAARDGDCASPRERRPRYGRK
jgi:diguanylate cyclase (GGDEF)-like protein/PAS domain S-box-containing protein